MNVSHHMKNFIRIAILLTAFSSSRAFGAEKIFVTHDTGFVTVHDEADQSILLSTISANLNAQIRIAISTNGKWIYVANNKRHTMTAYFIYTCV